MSKAKKAVKKDREITSEQVDALAQLANERDELQRNLNEAVAENELLKQQVEDLKAVLEKKEEAKVLSKADNQKAFKAALEKLKISVKDVFAHKEYPDKIVIVTKAGQKLVYAR